MAEPRAEPRGRFASRIDASLAPRQRPARTVAASTTPLGPVPRPRVNARAPNARTPGMPLVAEGDENTPPPGSGRSAVGRERNKNAQSARRAEARAATAEGREDKHLEAMHDASGATIRANSRRLATVGAGPEREVVKRDVEADIKRYVEFDVENRAACVQDYAKRADVPMLVCGSCGLRDPDEAIGMAAHGPVDLATISDQHWLHVGADALARMRAARTMRLLRVAPDTGEAERVDVRRELFHHFTEIDGKCYHVVTTSCPRRCTATRRCTCVRTAAAASTRRNRPSGRRSEAGRALAAARAGRAPAPEWARLRPCWGQAMAAGRHGRRMRRLQIARGRQLATARRAVSSHRR